MAAPNHKATWPRQFPWKPSMDADYRAAYEEESRRWSRDYNTCATCGSTNVHVENHSMMWHDGDVVCENGHYVRMYDAG